MDKKDVIFGLLALVALIGLLWYGGSLNKEKKKENLRTTPEAALYFSEVMASTTVASGNRPIEGFIPSMFMTSFPGLRVSDFEGVEAEQGEYKVEGDEIAFEYNVAVEERHTAAMAITAQGMNTLLNNIANRLSLSARTAAEVDVIVDAISLSQTANIIPTPATVTDNSNDNGANPRPDTPTTNPGNGGYVCTMDAKLCPDGSYVGRSGPRCEFAKCPGEVEAGFRTCPDEWIQDKMPGTFGDNTPREYFIIDGERWEIENFDLNWVKNNCSVEPQTVY